MSDQLFRDRVRERDLDNFLIEELHASPEFRDWLVSRLGHRFETPKGCEVRLQKSPPRLQDARQTDVQIGWFGGSGEIIARVLMESKVTADFQPGQVAAYEKEAKAARVQLGEFRAATVLIAPAARLATLTGVSSFDAAISIEEIADRLAARRGGDLHEELDSRLAMRIQLLEALCGRRVSTGWIATTVPEKRDFAQAYAALALERLPALRVRPSSDGPKAITRIFEGLLMKGLPAPALRHEFGNGVAWKWVNAQFAGLEPAIGRVRSSGVLSSTPYSCEQAGKSLAIRVPTPGIDPSAPFESQREAVVAGLEAMGSLVAWLKANEDDLAVLLAPSSVTVNSPPAPAGPSPAGRQAEREFATALRDTYDQCDALGYRPTGLLQMMEQSSGIETARRLLSSPPSEGFGRLALLGRLDLAIESLVLQPRWDGLFSEDERRIARRRLR